MKHGIKLRKLGRTSSHRQALLRNLVAALLHHEQIQTTLPKAKEAVRVVEKMITLGKKGTESAQRSAQSMLFPAHHYAPPSTSLSPIASSSTTPTPSPTSLLPKLFSHLPLRYASRPGGYTRITKYGRRPGDNGEKCIVSLVDGPRDLKWEMVGRSVGKEIFERSSGDGVGGLKGVRGEVERIVEGVVGGEGKGGEDGVLREWTRRGLGQVLKYRDEADRAEFVKKAVEYAHSLAAAPTALQSLSTKPSNLAFKQSSINKSSTLSKAGYPLPAPSSSSTTTTTNNAQPFTGFVTGLGLARGLLGKRKERREVKGLLPLSG